MLDEWFIGGEVGAIILSDNIFYGNSFGKKLKFAVENADDKKIAKVFDNYVLIPKDLALLNLMKIGKLQASKKKMNQNQIMQ